jgi:hypothetical protein
MTVRKTKPTVTLAAASPAGAAGPGGPNDVLRFTVAADVAGDVELNTLTFKVTTTDNTPNNWNKCTAADAGFAPHDFTLYDAADLNTALVATKTGYRTDGVACGTDDAGVLGHVRFALGPVKTIAAGTSKTFVLKVETTGASGRWDDTVRFDVMDESEAMAGNEFQWSETGVGAATDISGLLVKNLPVTGGTIWY